MNPELILKQLNLLFLDNDLSLSADAYALFSPIFRSVSLAKDLTSARERMKYDAIDLIISDIELGNEDGLTFIEETRQNDPDLPIIILSAYTEKDYLLRAANLRLDGYITKPMTFKKLNPILKRISSRLAYKTSKVRLNSEIAYDFNHKQLNIAGALVSTGKKERLLLELLIENRGKLVTRNQVEMTVWPCGSMTDSALKNLVSELRKKTDSKLIKTIPSAGWVLL